MMGPGVATGNAPSARLPLAFMLAAPVAFVMFHALLAVWADDVLVAYLVPRAITLTHIMVLGWITTVMMGALYQLAPVVFQTRLFSQRLAFVQLALHLAGVPGLIWSFWRGLWTPGLAAFGALVVLSVLLFVLNIGMTLWRRTAWNNTGWFVAHALAFLTLTVGMGLYFALDLRYGWWPITQRVLATHVHLGLVGWFTYLLMGVSYRLIPMFAVVHGHGERTSRWVMRFLNVGMLGVILVLPHDSLGRPWVLLTAGLLAAGALLYAVDVARMARRRARKELDVTQWHNAAAVLCLLAAVALGLRLAAGFGGDAGAANRWALTYGYVALAGWLSFPIMGHYYKIVPFIVWQFRYRSRVGKGPVPLFRDLFDERLARGFFCLYAAAFVVTAAGLLSGTDGLVRAGAAGGLVAVLGFAFTVSMAFWRRPAVRGRSAAAPAVREGA